MKQDLLSAVKESIEEGNDNLVKSLHNQKESEKPFWKKKNYLSYSNDKFLKMIKLFRNKLNE